MWSYPLVIGVSLIAVLTLSVIVYSVTGEFTAVLVVFTLAAILGYVLNQYGYLKISTDKSGIDVKFFETAPAPVPAAKIVPDSSNNAVNLHQKEVFYISGNDYTYDDAPAVCAAYGADLASYDQLMEAYSAGAEWCGYGWSKGGMALYPTQESTWAVLQGEADTTKRTSCGRPGVNGGYFDPKTKFGVNCYGIKPENKGTKFPIPIPGTNTATFNKDVEKYKAMLNKMIVSPFNRAGWSEWNVSTHK